MKKQDWISILMIAGVVASGCHGTSGEKAGGSEGGGKHAAQGVVPGSYEDWCGEHGVPESACTRCDPSLIAAFKATNDWCAEHGLPESQCLKCHPDLKIERPTKPKGT
jgi:hypothetical protein